MATAPGNPDCNGDGVVDIRDVICAINLVQSQPPPDPGEMAPPLDPTVATNLSTATEFLYTTGIQTGVTPGTIEPRRVAVLRGKVLDRDNAPLPGVKITILNHPELGQTQSRTDGMFDMAVNGGGLLTVKYEKAGFLPLQRQSDLPWQNFVMLTDVVMVGLDAQVTPVTLSAGSPLQVAQGSVASDDAGSRWPALLFPPGTQASVFSPDGTTQPVSTLNVRLTELTVGPNGPKAMPAELPPNSAYTYAIALAADEAVTKINGKDVLFSQPVVFYVDNFLNFPVGIPVPMGYYDNDRGVWVASQSGRIVKILGVSNGLADLDVDGDGVADTGTALSNLGITDAERGQLAGLYAPGVSLWRASLPHLSTWDANWGFGPPPDAKPPRQPQPRPKRDENPCKGKGSIIACQNQALGEAVKAVGTPFSLHYQSDRVPGRTADYSLDIPLSGASVPASLKRIDLEVQVAGRSFAQSFSPAPAQSATFNFDGQDAYGRTPQGSQPATVRIGYVYDGVYQRVERFGYNGNGIAITGSRTRREVTLWQTQQTAVGAWDARGLGLGGWSLSAHHAYDPAGKVLYLGDGRQRSTESIPPVVTTVAVANQPTALAAAPDGTLYVYLPPILRVESNGTASTVAGTESLLTGSGTPYMGLGPDGSLYVFTFEGGSLLVRRVDPSGGGSTIVAGGGSSTADGIPALSASIDRGADGMAVGPDGSVYLTDLGIVSGFVHPRIRRVTPDGIITTVAGNGTSGFSGDGGPATSAGFEIPKQLAVGPDSSIYINDLDNHSGTGRGGSRIRRVGPDGIIFTVAGTGFISSDPSAGDGGPATNKPLSPVTALAVGADGGLYIADGGFVYRVGADGIITTVAGGSGSGSFNQPRGDGGPATAGWFSGLKGLALGPDGSLYLSDTYNYRIRRVAVPLPGQSAAGIVIPSEDGAEIYAFDPLGRHLRTLDALTGALRYQFGYDAQGRLASITDAFGNVTTIERDGNGNPTAIVGPYGQRTILQLDGNGYLAGITNPASESVQLTSTGDGLLTALTDPRGNLHRFRYDALGLLVEDDDPAGGRTTLTRTNIANGHIVTVTTALGRTTTYQVERLPNGDHRRLNTFPDGTQAQLVISLDGTNTTRFADGTVSTIVFGPDPRFGMLAPIPSKVTLTTPGGLSSISTMQRSVTLANPGDPLSLQSLTDTVTINGKTLTRTYSGSTRVFTDTTPQGRTRTITLDAFGRVTQAELAGLLPVAYGYDSRGRLASVAQGMGAETRTATASYNAEGFLDTVTDPLGRTVQFAYDTAGRVARQTLADGSVIALTYDANGNPTAVTPPGRSSHTFAYTPVDLESTYTPPDVGAGTNQTLYAYNSDRQATRITRPDSQVLDFGYDAAGRLGTLTFLRGNLSYGYNATSGHLTSTTAPGGLSLAYTYDGGLLSNTIWAGLIAGSVRGTYDSDLRIISQSIDSGNTIAFSFDLDSLLSQAGSLTVARNVQNGLPTGSTLGNVTEAMGYNGFGEPISSSISFSGSALYAVQYTHDSLGRITQKVETIGSATNTYDYQYDSAGRLVEVKKNGVLSASYTYDSNGNRLTGPIATISYSYDNQDRLLTRNSELRAQNYSYTANGELLTKTKGAQTTAYQYDELGNLVRVTLPAGTQIDYLIDGHNRRIGKRVNGTLRQGFLYADWLKMVAELDGSNNIVSRFVYAGRMNVPAYMIRGGTTYRIITDHLGSPRLVVDVATGQIAQRLDYDEFGNVTTDTNPGFQPFGFAGGLYDRDTNLMRFGLRDYDAESGRWTAKDLIGFGGGDANLYQYVSGDPINRTDRLGAQSESIWENLANMFPLPDESGAPPIYTPDSAGWDPSVLYWANVISVIPIVVPLVYYLWPAAAAVCNPDIMQRFKQIFLDQQVLQTMTGEIARQLPAPASLPSIAPRIGGLPAPASLVNPTLNGLRVIFGIKK